MTVTPLKTVRRDTDPLRDELAAAHRSQAEANELVDRQRAAIEKTRIALREAERAVKAAEEGIQTARENHAAALADAAASNAAPPASAMRKARQSAEDAADHLESTKIAFAALKTDLPLKQNAAREADAAVEIAISEILAVHAGKILEKAHKVAAELTPYRNLLFPLLNERPFGTADALAWDRTHKPLDEVRAAARQFLYSLTVVGGDAADPWEIAREKLRADPNAPLPEI